MVLERMGEEGRWKEREGEFKVQMFETEHLDLVNLKVIPPAPRENFLSASINKLIDRLFPPSPNALLSAILIVAKVSS